MTRSILFVHGNGHIPVNRMDSWAELGEVTVAGLQRNSVCDGTCLAPTLKLTKNFTIVNQSRTVPTIEMTSISRQHNYIHCTVRPQRDKRVPVGHYEGTLVTLTAVVLAN